MAGVEITAPSALRRVTRGTSSLERSDALPSAVMCWA